MMDSTANPSNRTGQLAAQFSVTPAASPNSGFSLNPLCVFQRTNRQVLPYGVSLRLLLEEGSLVRISCKTNYDFLSVKFAKFLRDHSGFSTEDLVYASGQDMDTVLLCLMRLKSKKILMEEVRNKHEIMPDRFNLLVSPYVDTDAPEWVNGYAGMSFSNIRHS